MEAKYKYEHLFEELFTFAFLFLEAKKEEKRNFITDQACVKSRSEILGAFLITFQLRLN